MGAEDAGGDVGGDVEGESAGDWGGVGTCFRALRWHELVVCGFCQWFIQAKTSLDPYT